MSVAHSQESAGVFLTLSSCSMPFGELICRRPSLASVAWGESGGAFCRVSSLCAEDLFWPAVLAGGGVCDGKLATSSSGTSSGFGSPKAKH